MKHGIKHILIEPGCPTQNAYIESFNGTLRDECLDENWFESLEQARQIIARWRADYNEIRPHSSCGRVPPATFAATKKLLLAISAVYRAPLPKQSKPAVFVDFHAFNGII